MAVQNLDKITKLLQGAQDQGVMTNAEITEDVKKTFNIQDNRDSNKVPSIDNTDPVNQVANEGQNGFSVAPQRKNLSAKDAQMISENFQAPGDRASAVLSNVGQQNPGVAQANPDDLAEFEGTAIEGKTAKGVPEPEEISGVGKAFKDFANILETPGARQFLARMGIAFSEGRKNEPGTILGEASLSDIEGEAQKKITQGLLAGKSMDEIDLGGAQVSSETINQARQNALTRQKFEESKEQFDTQTETTRRGQNIDFALGQKELDLMEKQLGLRKDELNLDKIKAAAEMTKDRMPDDVSASAWGTAQKMAASTFLDVAKETFRNEEGELAKVSEIMNTLSTQNVGIDPTKIRSRLPDHIKQQFDNYVASVAKSVSRTGQTPTQGGGFDIPTNLVGAVQRGVVSPEVLETGGMVTKIPNSQEGLAQKNQLPDGSVFKVEGKPGYYVKRGNTQIRLGGSQ